MGFNRTPRRGLLKIFRRLGATLCLTSLLVIGIGVIPSSANPGPCIECHGAFTNVHGNVNHNAQPASSPVAIFPDNGHDDAGWHGPKPYFGVLVDCNTCHNLQLPTVHDNDCSICHPTPYDTLQRNWTRGCQQGGCHTGLHQDIFKAHQPFENPYDSQNDCSRCHLDDGSVVQSQCLNCHAAYTAGDTTPPVTTSNAKDTYLGAAEITLSVTEYGKVGIGLTYYRLDGGPQTIGSKVYATTPGSHELEFWSVDQAGNLESPSKKVYFTVVQDTIPPTTTSNAQSSYSFGGVITLTATDEGGSGVKTTYYSLNGGPVQTGTSVSVPATSTPTTNTLVFWSEDWAGNIETEKSVAFTTTGSGTIRLVWGNSDNDPSTAPQAGDWAAWYIYKGSWSGPLVAKGSARSPGWNGINDVAVPLSSTPYFVRVDWYWAEGAWEDQTLFSNVYVTMPGQVVRLSY